MARPEVRPFWATKHPPNSRKLGKPFGSAGVAVSARPNKRPKRNTNNNGYSNNNNKTTSHNKQKIKQQKMAEEEVEISNGNLGQSFIG